MKSLFEERSIKGYPNELLLAATQSRGVVTKAEYGLRTVVAQSGLESLKLVEPGDFVISLRSFEGGIEVSHARGIISPAYTVLRLRNPQQQRYIMRLFKSRYFLDAIRMSVTGIREGQSINYQRLGRTRIPIPVESDMLAINRYLDHAELQIGRAIQGKSEVARLLREIRGAMINELVLGGLVIGADTTDSGISGIGRVPNHWRLLRAKYVWKSKNVRSKTGDEERLSVSSVSGIVPRSSKTVTMFEAASYVGHKIVEPGELVINSLWAWATGLGVARQHGIVSPVYGVYELRPEAQSDLTYLDYLLRSNAVQWQFQVQSKGIWRSRLQLSDDAFFRIVLPLPPIDEQVTIAKLVSTRTSELDDAIGAAEHEIDLLREYRTRLIADVVTGKKDVRAESAILPDVDLLELTQVLSGASSIEDDVDEEVGADAD
jgi:type I restriction enzyme S subunit